MIKEGMKFVERARNVAEIRLFRDGKIGAEWVYNFRGMN
jgi:hypothetical protein